MGMVLAGGFAGFWLALLGFLFLGLSPLATLLIWAGSGPLAAAFAILATLVRQPQRAPSCPGSTSAA